MSPKGKWITFAVASVLVAAGAAAMIYLQQEEIEKNRQESTRLQGEIAKARALLKTTPDLVKEVIIQRETDDVIREILSDDQEVNSLVRTLYGFGEASGIAISSIKPQRQSNSGRNKQDFDRVAYTLNFESTAWELLDFLDRVETHARFMSVTAFKLSAARRASFRDGVEPRHRVQMDLETYVYEPKAGGKEARIDGYDHKKELLISEIRSRTSDLQVPTYDYNGPRGRRDPWVDPRMPADAGEDGMDITAQIALVEELMQQVATALEHKAAYESAETIIEEIKAMALLEDTLEGLEGEVRRLQSDSVLTFVSAIGDFESGVVEPVEALRAWVEDTGGDHGPDLTELQAAYDQLESHITRQEYELARDVYGAIEPRLRNVPLADQARQEIIAAMFQANQTIGTVLDFESIPLDIEGVALYEGRRPVALINGQPIAEGELLSDDLVVRNIKSDQIEFAYRGLVLARPIESALTSPR